MDPADRVVTRIPLSELWTDRGRVAATRVRRLSQADVAAALRGAARPGELRFVVANPGDPLRWLTPVEVLKFWCDQARGRIVEPEARAFPREDYPGEYCFTASEWREPTTTTPIYVFERHH